MTDIELSQSSGNPLVDRILQGLVGVFEMLFPEKIKAYILTGSYMAHHAVGTSDIDIYIIFKQPLDAEEYAAFWRAKTRCNQISPVDLDLKPFSYPQLKRLGYPNVRDYGQTLYGEDFASDCEPMAGEAVQLLGFHALNFIFRARGNPPELVFPLSVPDANMPFYGYAKRAARAFGENQRQGTKSLINIASRTAMSMIALETGLPVFSKRECMESFRSRDEDPWQAFLEDVEHLCRDEWDYKVPEGEMEQRKLKDICLLALEFENHYLGMLREHLLEELQRESRPNLKISIPDLVFLLGFHEADLGYFFQKQAFSFIEREGEFLIDTPNILRVAAAYTLGKVLFPDPLIAEELAGLLDHPDPLLRHAANRSHGLLQTGKVWD